MSRSGLIRNILILVLGVAVTACAATYRNHGFAPTDAELEEIIIGVDTRVSVEERFGLPSTQGVRTNQGFYYVADRWRHFGPLKPKPVERTIVAISFDSDEVVTNVERFGLERGQVVALSRRATEGGSGEISLLRQLLGNFGRVNAGQLLGQGL